MIFFGSIPVPVLLFNPVVFTATNLSYIKLPYVKKPDSRHSSVIAYVGTEKYTPGNEQKETCYSSIRVLHINFKEQ